MFPYPSTNTRLPIKRALIVVMTYRVPRCGVSPLHNSEQDDPNWQSPWAMLMDRLTQRDGYRKEDVVFMCEDSPNPKLVPKKNNILHQISLLVSGTQAGDRLVFYLTGHGGQVFCRTGTEDDMLDEYVLPINHHGWLSSGSTFDPEDMGKKSARGKILLDNKFRQYLIDPLPIGVHLTALVDTCHSATMLDLDHYNCNKVYYPWYSQDQSPTPHCEQHTTTSDEAPDSEEDPQWLYDDKDQVARCSSPSPEPEDRCICDGQCPPDQLGHKIFSLAPTLDSQSAYDIGGESMTSILLRLLELNPKISRMALVKETGLHMASLMDSLNNTALSKRTMFDSEREQLGSAYEPQWFDSSTFPLQPQVLQVGGMGKVDLEEPFGF